MPRGPVEVLFLTLPEDIGFDKVAAILRPPVERGFIKIIDCVLMGREADGSIAARDLEDADGLPSALRGLGIDPHDLLSDADVEIFGESLSDDELGLAVVYELVWAREAIANIQEIGAEVQLLLRIPPDEVENAFSAAGATA